MYNKGVRRRLAEAAQPAEQRRLIGMRRKPTYRVDARPDRHRLPEDMHQLRTIDQPPTERSGMAIEI